MKNDFQDSEHQVGKEIGSRLVSPTTAPDKALEQFPSQGAGWGTR